MIDYIKGEIAELSPTQVILDCNGIGYALNITLNSYTAIQKEKHVKLFVYEVIREDAHILFGFFLKEERELFVQLISVSGIGGNTARMMLSAFSSKELANIIVNGDEKMLKSVKGIGLKTAQRVIVELKDKVSMFADGGTSSTNTSTAASFDQEIVNGAVSALTILGFPPAASQKAVMKVVKGQSDCTVEMVIKSALKIL